MRQSTTASSFCKRRSPFMTATQPKLSQPASSSRNTAPTLRPSHAYLATNTLSRTAATSAALSRIARHALAEAKAGAALGLASYLSLLVRCIVQLNLDVHSSATTKDGKGNLVSRLVRIHRCRHILWIRNLLTIHRDDQVPSQHHWVISLVGSLRSSMQAGLLRCATRQNSLNQKPIICR